MKNIASIPASIHNSVRVMASSAGSPGDAAIAPATACGNRCNTPTPSITPATKLTATSIQRCVN